MRGIDAARGMRAAICRARVARERQDAESKRPTCRRLRPAITRSCGSLGTGLVWVHMFKTTQIVWILSVRLGFSSRGKQ